LTGNSALDFDRLRRKRLARAKALLAKSEWAALLLLRHEQRALSTSTHIRQHGLQDKMSPLLSSSSECTNPFWDFGSAAKHHQLIALAGRAFARRDSAVLRGAMSPEMGRAEDVARKSRVELEKPSAQRALGIDIVEPPYSLRAAAEGSPSSMDSNHVRRARDQDAR